MRYQQSGDRHPQNRIRPASTGRIELPNLAVLNVGNSREQRKLQLFGEALIRDIKAYRHRKGRREETNALGNLFRSGGAR